MIGSLQFRASDLAARDPSARQDPEHGHPSRIVHVLPSVGPDSGGPATVACRMAAAQATLGHQVSIVSSLSPDARSGFEQSIAHIPGFERVQLLINPWTSPLHRWFGTRLSPIYQSLFRFADIVHIHGVWEPMLLVAARVARRLGVPYIVRPCGMLDPWNLAYRAWKKKLAMSVAHRRMLNGAAFLQTLNADEYRLLAPLGLSPPRMIIPNAVFLDEVDDRSGEQSLDARIPMLRDKPYVLFLGRLHEKKGLDILIEAFSKAGRDDDDTNLLVVGPDGGARSRLVQRAKELGLEKRVHVVGPLYGAEKFAAYRRAACFCLPSRQEGFSLAVTEALACRTPVAISEECHFPEVAAGAGEVFPLSIEATAGALDRLLKAPPLRRRQMGEAGRKLVEQKFTWDRVAEMTLCAYHSIGQAARR